MSCRNCKYLEVAPNAAGKIVPRKGKSYRCKAPDPEQPILPHSILRVYGFKWAFGRSYMSPEDGEGCLMWEYRK